MQTQESKRQKFDQNTENAINVYKITNELTKTITAKKQSLKSLQKHENTQQSQAKVNNEILRLRKERRELLDSLTKNDKTRIIGSVYIVLFEQDLSRNKQIEHHVKTSLKPDRLLSKQLKKLEQLEQLVINERASKENIDQFFDLLQKVNRLLIIIKNLELNIPQKAKLSTKAQQTAIETPINAASMLTKLLIQGKSRLTHNFQKVENNVENHVKYKGFEKIRKRLISIPSFFTNLNTDVEARIKKEKKENLDKIYADIFNRPFEIVDSMGLDSTQKENHPKEVLFRIQNDMENTVDVSKDKDIQKIMALIDSVHKHELLASLLNMEVSHWRRFAELNMEVFKAISKKLKSETIRAIVFDESLIIPGVIDTQGDEEETVTDLNNQLVKSVKDTYMYDYHTWSIGEGSVGKTLNHHGIQDVFTTYNRCSRKHGNEKISIPAGEFAVIKPSNKEREKYDVKLNQYSLGESQGHKLYHERMLEIWINSNGDKKKAKKTWESEARSLDKTNPSRYSPELIDYVLQFTNNNIARKKRNSEYTRLNIFEDKKYLEHVSKQKPTDVKKIYISTFVDHIYETSHENDTYSNIKLREWWNKYSNQSSEKLSFDKIFADVSTIPCVLLTDSISQSNTANGLEEELLIKTNEFRSNFSSASTIFVYGVNKKGDIALLTNQNHSEWDGGPIKQLDEKIMGRMLDNTTHIQLEEQQIISTDDKSGGSVIDTKKTISNKNGQETESNHPVQSYVEAEGFVRLCDEIATLTRKLTKGENNQINPDTKLKNPAVIMQLILIYDYREILMNKVNTKDKKTFSEDDNIGMLISNSDITKDLDLGPIKKGFNLRLFNNLSEEQKINYLIHQSILLDISLANTNMSLIKKVVESIPFQFIQEKLNDLSKTRLLLDGLRKFSDTNMISHFGLSRIINDQIQENLIRGYKAIRSSFSAHAPMQDGSLTITEAGFINSNGREKYHLSVACKNTKDENAIKIIKALERVIGKYNRIYEEGLKK